VYSQESFQFTNFNLVLENTYAYIIYMNTHAIYIHIFKIKREACIKMQRRRKFEKYVCKHMKTGPKSIFRGIHCLSVIPNGILYTQGNHIYQLSSMHLKEILTHSKSVTALLVFS